MATILLMLALAIGIVAQDTCESHTHITTTRHTTLTSTSTTTVTLAFASTGSALALATGPFWYYNSNGTTVWVGGNEGSIPVTSSFHIPMIATPLLYTTNPTPTSTLTFTSTSTLTSTVSVHAQRPEPITITRTVHVYPSPNVHSTNTRHVTSTKTIHSTVYRTLTVSPNLQSVTVSSTANQLGWISATSARPATTTLAGGLPSTASVESAISVQSNTAATSGTLYNVSPLTYPVFNSSALVTTTSGPSYSPLTLKSYSTTLVQSMTLSFGHALSNGSYAASFPSAISFPLSSSLTTSPPFFTSEPNTGHSNNLGQIMSSPPPHHNSISTASQISPSSSFTVTLQPSVCGEHGNFTLNWDDEPEYTPSAGSPILFPPVFNPYHHLFFSSGYVYAPPPSIPFGPVSLPHMAVFMPSLTGAMASSNRLNAAHIALMDAHPGKIGAGPRADETAYWFNVYSLFVGCDNPSIHDCQITISGFVWDAQQQTEILAATHVALLPRCTSNNGCQLTQLFLSPADHFTGLSGLQISARVGGFERAFYVDDLHMGWFDNSCAAGLARVMSH